MSDPRWRGGDYYGHEPPEDGLALAPVAALVPHVVRLGVLRQPLLDAAGERATLLGDADLGLGLADGAADHPGVAKLGANLLRVEPGRMRRQVVDIIVFREHPAAGILLQNTPDRYHGTTCG